MLLLVARNHNKALRWCSRRTTDGEVEAVPGVEVHVAVATADLSLVSGAFMIAFLDGDGAGVVIDRVAAPALLAILIRGEAVSFVFAGSTASLRSSTVWIPVHGMVCQGSEVVHSITVHILSASGQAKNIPVIYGGETDIQHPVSTIAQ